MTRRPAPLVPGQSVTPTWNRGRLEALIAALGDERVREWIEAVSKGPSTDYDRAMDSDYTSTHEGGYNHRMFDGGHDPAGAWEKVKDASDSDTFWEEVRGYFEALWNDLVTDKGLPFFTWDQDTYEACAEWVSSRIPGVDKRWFYDLCSFDAGEILATGVGCVSVLFAFDADDRDRLWRLLGAMGVAGAVTANPLIGLAAVGLAAYAYFVKKWQFAVTAVGRGGTTATVSFLVFGLFGLPFLVELVIAMVLAKTIDQFVFDDEKVRALLSASVERCAGETSGLLAKLVALLRVLIQSLRLQYAGP